MNFKLTKTNIIGIILCFLGAFIWGMSFVTQYLGGNDLGSFSFTSIRSIFGCAMIVVLMIIFNLKDKKEPFWQPGDDKKNIIIKSAGNGVVMFFAIVTQQIGINITLSAHAGFIASLCNICVPILTLFMGKKINMKTWFFIALALFGLGLFASGTTEQNNFPIEQIIKGDIWCMVSTFLFSIAAIQINYWCGDIESYKFSFFRFLTVAIISGVVAIIIEWVLPGKTFQDFINTFIKAFPALVVSGFLSCGLAYTFQTLGQRMCDIVVATMILSLEGVFGAIGGAVFLGQTMSWLQIIGAAIMMVSIIYVQLNVEE